MKKLQLDRDDEKKLKKYQLRKQLFARLATIPSLEALPKQEKRALVREAERAGMPTKALSGLSARMRPPVPIEAQQAWGMKTPPPPAWGAIFGIHPWVQQLPDLLDGKTIRLPIPSPPAAYKLYEIHVGMRKAFGVDVVAKTQWVSDGSKIFAHCPPPHEVLLEDFAASLTESKLPYRRCAVCKSSIFVVVGRYSIFVPELYQRYCSTKCSSREYEARRKNDPERKAAVLKNMKRYRKKLKDKKQAEEKQPVVTLRGTFQRKHGQA